MKNKVQFMLCELIMVVFFVMLSAVVLNPSIGHTLTDEPIDKLPMNNSASVSSDSTSGTTSVSSQDSSTSEIDSSGASQTGDSPNISDWNLILANDKHPLEAEFIDSIQTKKLPNGLSVDERIYEPLNKMLDDAEKQGYHLIVCSGYRSYDKQVELFNNRVQRYRDVGYTQEEAYEKGKTSVALPGASEHHTGLAVDIVCSSYQNLDDGMMSRPEIKWLYANCQKYGFIVRYPSDKSDITGIIHEPWHYRYVGVEAATEIMDKDICLEEYLGMT